MKMNTFQSIATLIAICFLFGMMSSSNAAEITYLSTYAYSDWGSGGDIYASLTTDEDIYVIDWYIDNVKIKTTDHYHSPTRYVSVYLDTRTGEIKGVKYEVKAVAWFSDVENNTFISDTVTDDVKVYKPIYLHQEGENTGAYGSVQISRFYYDGSQIIMDAYIYAYNPTNNPKAKDPENYPLSVLPWFRTDKYDAPNGQVDEKKHHRDTKPIEIIQLGKTSQTYNPGPRTDPEPWRGGGQLFHRDVGIIEQDKPLYYNAHAHLQVFDGFKPADNWEVDTQQQTGTAAVTFTEYDGP